MVEELAILQQRVPPKGIKQYNRMMITGLEVTIFQKKPLRSIAELSMLAPTTFNADSVGVMNKVHKTHFLIPVNVMDLLGLFIMNASRCG